MASPLTEESEFLAPTCQYPQLLFFSTTPSTPISQTRDAEASPKPTCCVWQGLENENQRHLKEHSIWALGQGLGTLPEQLGSLVRHFDANAQLGPVHSLFTPQGYPQGICSL